MGRRMLAGALGVALAIGGAAVAAKVDLAAVLADAGRPDADKARDADRKPAELMAFAGVKPGAKIAELAPGGGYFTRLLSPAVGPAGKVYAMAGKPSQALTDYAAAHPNVAIVTIQPGEIKAPEPVDIVWTTLNYHDFKNNKVGDADVASLINAAAFKALKPGGVYLIVDHQTAKGAGATQTSTLHRIEDVVVKQEVEAAGFKLDATSPLLAHAGDDHSLKVQETGVRGKTDQFVLRFRKPKR
jgi:predicted methyltransferase